MNESDWI